MQTTAPQAQAKIKVHYPNQYWIVVDISAGEGEPVFTAAFGYVCTPLDAPDHIPGWYKEVRVHTPLALFLPHRSTYQGWRDIPDGLRAQLHAMVPVLTELWRVKQAELE